MMSVAVPEWHGTADALLRGNTFDPQCSEGLTPPATKADQRFDPNDSDRSD
jgi:hypothetical protein